MTTKIQPRPVNEDEERILCHFLQQWKDSAPYVRQIPSLVVTGRCDCGCVSVDFDTPDDTPADVSDPHTSPLPVEADLSSDDGRPIGGVLIFQDHGRMTSLEAYSFMDEPIMAWPPNRQIVVHVR